MSDRRSWASTVAGWFVVQDPPTADNELPEPAAPPPPQPELNVFTAPPPAAPGGAVDFDQVYEAAGVDADERQRVSRTLDLLNSRSEERRVGKEGRSRWSPY